MIALILECCIMGCSGLASVISSPNIVIKTTYQASVLDLLKNPVPITTHFDLVNTGKGDGNDVQIEVEFSYNNEVVKKEMVYFGTMKARESKVKDEVILVPLPANPDSKLVDMQ